MKLYKIVNGGAYVNLSEVIGLKSYMTNEPEPYRLEVHLPGGPMTLQFETEEELKTVYRDLLLKVGSAPATL